MRVAAGDAVIQIVVLAIGVLREDFLQIRSRGRDRLRGHGVHAAALPIGQHEQHGDGRDHAADQRVDQARRDQLVGRAGGLVEAHQHHQRDGRRADHIALRARDEEHHARAHRDERLHSQAGKQLEQGPARQQPQRRARDALDHARDGRAISGLAHEQSGQQNPVAMLRVGELHGHTTGGQRGGQAHGVAHQRRIQMKLLADARPAIGQAARGSIEQRHIAKPRAVERAGRQGELRIQRREIARQRAQRTQRALPLRAVLLLQVANRVFQIDNGMRHFHAAFEGLARTQRFGQARTGRPLQTQHALAAEQHIAVEQLVGPVVVEIVR